MLKGLKKSICSHMLWLGDLTKPEVSVSGPEIYLLTSAIKTSDLIWWSYHFLLEIRIQIYFSLMFELVKCELCEAFPLPGHCKFLVCSAITKVISSLLPCGQCFWILCFEAITLKMLTRQFPILISRRFWVRLVKKKEKFLVIWEHFLITRAWITHSGCGSDWW